MRSLRLPAALLFFSVLALHCLCIFYGWQEGRFITKILLVPILIGALFISRNRFPFWVYAGLAGCFLGDLLLTRNGELFFMLGMLAFILAHIFNGIYFYRLQHSYSCRMREAFIMAVWLMLLSAVVFAILNPYLGKLRIPILVYMVIISVMSILAASTTGNSTVKPVSLLRFIPGAGFFVLSDAMLALNKFLVHDPHLDIPVMLSYGGALYFLADGFSRVAAGSTRFAKN
ncbi:MAG: lysoplasmalogenase [Chitinophagaceae bacterium]|nr:lysoplasmalogenase [Chitinophagaceae bacterium]